jgi:glycosyltransferase involved in cell wall biosynthesis
MADTLTETDFLAVPASVTIDGGVEYLAKTAVGGRAMVDFIRRSEAYYQILGKRSLDYLQTHHFRAEKIVHIPNGVDTTLFMPRPELRPDPEQVERDILCVARLSFPKGIDILLHAWKRMLDCLEAQHVALKPRLLLAGDGELAPQLERIVQLLGIEESVKFLGSRTDVVNLLQQAWAFVLPSRWEGMPNALLEAMSCGLPCVATRVSGSEDLITDEENGLLVDTEEPVALAQALVRLVVDTPLCERLGKHARETIMQKYQLSTITEQCLAFFHRTLAETQERGKKKGI